MLKIAGYCRVSTDKEDQANSFASQQQFFREYITRNPDWELHEIYADEGITGTSTKKRVQFNRMINDAHSGRFQMILTKEVSRFSRNILDTIFYTRELKALGIGVIFMTDGFSSLDADAELRLSIMGSIAQEESRKTSARVKWGQTRQMERGVVFGTSMLGYDVKNGEMKINPAGAEIVRQIFYKYGIEKKGSTVIARELQEAGCQTRTQKAVWSAGYILKILKNEKYAGDLVQKKTFTPDYLTHEKKYNHGHEDYIIHKDHHAPIITRELWNLVQEEIEARNRHNGIRSVHSNRYLFSGKIICGECGAKFISRSKSRRDGTSYRRWGCAVAARQGRKKVDSLGNTCGCDVGKQIRHELAMEILICAVRRIVMNYKTVIYNTASLAAHAAYADQSSAVISDRLKKSIEHIKRKKDAAVDTYLSEMITKDEFMRIKDRYDTELEGLLSKLTLVSPQDDKSNQQLYEELYAYAESVITCQICSDPFLKELLDYMKVYKNGTVEIKLNGSARIQSFQLYQK